MTIPLQALEQHPSPARRGRETYRGQGSILACLGPCRPRRWRALGAAAGVFLAIGLGDYGADLRAADKSGVTPNSISLPKGPGSIEGLGESFQPSLNSGTAAYGIPLQLPPGTAGHAPTLRLGYEGGGANGPLGFGWQLGIPSVQRRSDEGIPLYPDEPPPTRGDDWSERYTTFLDTGNEELVPQANGDYFGRVEGSFVRYRRQGSGWEGTQPDGTRLEFGVTEPARIQEGPDRIFRWLLERETDTHGNTITYAYDSFADAQNSHQKYLREIRYGPGAPPWDNFHFVLFQYEDRPDWFEDCRSGFPVRTGKRLRTIVIGTQGPELPGHLAGDFNNDGIPDHLNRRYELEYLNYDGPDTHWSLLAKVTVVGADGVTSLPPATHGYTVSNPPEVLSAAGKTIGGANEPPLVMDSPHIEFADLNGDGMPDVLRTYPGGGAHQAYLNLGETEIDGSRVIHWSAPQAVDGDPLAWNINLESTSDVAHLSDMNGDGLADLVYRSAFGEVYYFGNLAPNRWGDRRQMSVSDVVPPSPFGALPGVKSADLDFDKRMDVVQSIDTGVGTDYRVWFNLGNDTFARSTTVPQSAGLHLALPGVQIVDFNGDRVPDIVWVRPTQLEVTAGLGYGRFGDRVFVPLPNHPATSRPIDQATLNDITGDGLPDLVLERAAPGQLWYWVNLGNYSLSPLKTVTDLPVGIGANAVIRWADINGNGTTDLVYADSLSEPHLQAVDIGRLMNVEAGPNILTTISNGIGAVTLIGYRPSTHYALEDATAGSPWPDPVPFPVQVVSAITNLDSLGHQYITRFRYHNGYYDPIKKQFRGFAHAEQIDVGDSEAPTLVTRSHFDIGKTWRAMKGKLLRLTAEQEDGRVFTDETTHWTDPPVTLMTGTNGEPVTYAHPVALVKRIVELGQGEERRLESEFGYDRYGNETTNASYGIVVDGDRAAFDDERITTTQYAVNTNAWILRLPAREEVMDENGSVISRVENFYDDETFSGSNFGQVTLGNLTLSRDWIDPADPTNFVAASRVQYDVYGNPRVTLDPLARAPSGVPDLSHGHLRVLDYDDRFFSHPITETTHLGEGQDPLVFRGEYEEGYGMLTRSTDLNGNVTDYGFDALARLTHIVRPGHTPEYPTAEYRYALAVPTSFPSPSGQGQVDGFVNYVETRRRDRSAIEDPKQAMYLISREFVDGLGRSLMTRSEAEAAAEGGPPRVVVQGALLFNARQKPARALNPFFTAVSSTDLDALLAYEAIEAPGWTGLFEQDGALVPLNLTNAHSSRTRYDATLRAVETENPDQTVARIVYEPLVTRTFDENDTDPTSPHFDTPILHYRDGLDRLIRVDELTRLNDDGTAAEALVGWSTRYEYDLNDQPTRITDSQNNVRTFAYDGLRRKTQQSDPDGGTRHYDYDAASNRTETRDAKNQRITYAYDGANRLLTEDYLDDDAEDFSYGRSPDVIYHYDNPAAELDLGGGATGAAANTKGKLAWVEDAAGEEHISYDARDRVQWTVKRTADPLFLEEFGFRTADLVSYRTTFEYDALDRVTRIVYPDQDSVEYEYNDRSLLRRIAGGPNGSIVSNLLYWPSAQLRQMDCGNGVRTTYRQDVRLRLNHLLAVAHPSSLNRQLISFTYEFDAGSNLKSITDTRPGSAVPAGDRRRNTQHFDYDSLDRLTRVQYAFNLSGEPVRNDGEIHYRYDRIGNMLSQSSTLDHHDRGLPVADLGEMDSGGSLGRWNRIGRAPNDPPGPHALSRIRNSETGSRDYSYDANGNLAAIDGLTNTWDFKDRLVVAENASMRAQYTYDYADRRILKQVWPKPAPGGLGGADRRGVSSVLSINKYFEVREHDRPVKYVWNGSTRVARLTGSASTNLRTQRLRVWPAWNLCSLAVTATNALAQLQANPLLELSAFRWNPVTSDWDSVAPNETLLVGTVLWLYTTTNATLTLTGVYSEPSNRSLPAGGGFLPGAGLEAWDLGWIVGDQPETAFWAYDARGLRWRSALPSPLETQSDLPPFIAPGEAVFVSVPSPAEFLVPGSALSIRYYLQDHLGSTSLVTDGNGSIVEETAFYPFGFPRNQYQTQPTEEPFGFTQKERDAETGLHYFEARYLAAALGRFTRVDPLAWDVPEGWFAAPQHLHAYAYALNKPLETMDPTGTGPLDWLRNVFGSGGGASTPAALPVVGSGFLSGRPDLIFRADTRGSDEIFRKGFAPRRRLKAGREFTAERIQAHVKGHNKNLLVSTTPKFERTFRFGAGNASQRVYVMDFDKETAPKAYWADKAFPQNKGDYYEDKEISLHGRMPGNRVVASYDFLKNKFEMNPNYTGKFTGRKLERLKRELDRTIREVTKSDEKPTWE